MAIITLKYLKSFLEVSTGGNTLDKLLNEIIDSVSKDIVRYCNQEIEQTIQTMEFSGNGEFYLLLPKYPIISITTLKSRTLPLYSWSDAISSDNYTVVDENIVPKLYYQNGFTKGNYNYQLVYVTGYATGSIPKDIQIVAAEMATKYFKDSDVKDGRLGISTLGVNMQGIGTNTTFKNMEKEWQTRLSKYRRPAI